MTNVLIDGDTTDGIGNNVSACRILDVLDMTFDVSLNSRIFEHTVTHRIDSAVLQYEVLGITEQLLCYTQNLILENCTIDPMCDRMFEYSTVEADIKGHIENIKNPTSGHIIADSIGSITIDENVRQPNNCVIETRK